jgi:MFS family permease
MLSLMMAFGIVSRIGSGFLADRIGGIRTLLIGSVAQGFALLFYLFFDGLTSLYLISAMFGLFQGGIVPSYAIIVRESMPASEAATRVGIVILASVVGMSFGGWVSGVIFDATGSYGAAFLNGLAWNAVNVTIMVALLIRARQRLAGRPCDCRAARTRACMASPARATSRSGRFRSALPSHIVGTKPAARHLRRSLS